MEAVLNVITLRDDGYENRRTPPEIHSHDVYGGDRITLEVMGQRYLIHVAAVTPDSMVLDIEGLRPLEDHRDGLRYSSHVTRRYTLPPNSALAFSIPMMDHSPTWKIEWTDSTAGHHRR